MEYIVKHLLIDKQKLRFLAVASSFAACELISENDHVDVPTSIVSLELASCLSCLSQLEMIMLHNNETGVKLNITQYGEALQRVYQLANALPVDSRSLTELSKINEGLPKIEPSGPAPHIPIYNRADASQSYPARELAPAEAKTRAPRDPSGTPSPRGATGKVWIIADRVHAECGGGLIDKNIRAKIIEACVAEGIHPATAATQYSKWKATK